MTDYISRDAAIDAVKTYWKNEVYNLDTSMGFEAFSDRCDWILERNAGIIKAIEALPSAQPTQITRVNSSNSLDCISRQAAIDFINSLPKWPDALSNCCLDYEDVISVLFDTEKLPSAQPERLPGTWIKNEDGVPACTICNGTALLDGSEDYVRSDFCPNCGADMRGEQNDETIDADALRNEFIIPPDSALLYATVVTRIIDDAPTIDPKPQWIPVKERLPDSEGKYLALWGGKVVDTAHFINGHFRLYGENKDHLISHWMPLPEPYKPEAEI